MRLHVLVLPLAIGTIAAAQACAVEDGLCTGHPNSVIISANQPHEFQYCDKNGNSKRHGGGKDIPVHLANASSITIVVENINPLRNSFSVSFNAKPFGEIDGSVLGKLLGITLPTSGSSGATGGTGALFEARLPCFNPSPSIATPTVSNLQVAVQKLSAEVDAYRDHVASMQSDYANSLDTLKSAQSNIQSKFQSELTSLTTTLNQISGSNQNYRTFATQPTLTRLDAENSPLLCSTSMVGKPLDQVADQLSALALDLYGSSGLTSDDKRYLKSILSPTSSTPSVIENLKSELTASSNLAGNIISEVGALEDIANDPSNFEIDQTLPPEDRIQSAVTVTVSWTDKSASPTQPASNAAAPAKSTPSQAGSSGSGAPASPSNTGSNSSNASATNSTTFTLNFGQGPRTFQSAGIVFSPLKQPSFSTIASGASATCTASAAPGGCIVKDDGSGWRILPMGLATVRLADLPWSQWRILVPNYFSFGATIKSNASSSTNLEYLAGLSWASPGQHVFFTAGTYGGAVTRLGGGLTLGPQTVAPPATLPTTSPYHWGFGFAISYAFASQGGSGSKKQNASSSNKSQAEQ